MMEDLRTRTNDGSTKGLLALLAGAAVLGYAWRRYYRRTADTRRALSGTRGVHVRESITIDAPVEDIYRFWRTLERLPEVMPQLESVEALDTRRSRWTAKAFDAVPVTWEAEIINDVPYETIGWKTV